MNTFIEVKAVRNYDIAVAGIARCDLCKVFKKTLEFLPESKLHNFDNIFLCKSCATKCGFDIREGVLDGLDVE